MKIADDTFLGNFECEWVKGMLAMYSNQMLLSAHGTKLLRNSLDTVIYANISSIRHFIDKTHGECIGKFPYIYTYTIYNMQYTFYIHEKHEKGWSI